MGLKFRFLKKNKIQRKRFKKRTHLINHISIFNKNHINIYILQNLFNYKCYLYRELQGFDLNIAKKPTFISIRQKKPNTKATISSKNTLNTFSIGSVMKYFKMQQGKYLRRSLKGKKIFFNFLINIFIKKYNLKNNNICVLNVIGIDYNTILIRHNLKKFFQKNIKTCIYIIYNIKVGFTKLKDKKVKSIKKRLKKKLILNLFKKT